MKQLNIFGIDQKADEQDEKEVYTSKIKIPIYEPKNKKPHILKLLDNSKTKRLIKEIENSDILPEEKKFLIEAAKRHNVFNYSKIADYYSQASKEMQALMERSALVIIDFDKAYEYGYIKLAHEIANSYFDYHGE